MFQIAYINGRYCSYAEGVTHVEDRANQFADGVYEVILFERNILIDHDLHMQRLERSLKELEITNAPSIKAIGVIIREVIERTGRRDGLLYMQISRGIASRDHAYPKNTPASLMVYLTRPKPPKQSEKQNGVAIITIDENRWQRRDIKSISLLPNVMAKQRATEASVREAVFVEKDGTVTEGSSTNIFIVKNNQIITRQADHSILPGVTRHVALQLARSVQIPVIEKAFTLAELESADECFLTSTSAGVLPIVICNSKKIGQGKPGTITKRLAELYDNRVESLVA